MTIETPLLDTVRLNVSLPINVPKFNEYLRKKPIIVILYEG